MVGAEHVDPRVVRTREMLLAAVTRLLQEPGLDPARLSITDITAAAGISRPTFYQHYASPDELVADAVRGSLRTLIASGGTDVRRVESTPPETLVALLREINRHRWLYGRLAGQTSPFGYSRQTLLDHIAGHFAKLIDVHNADLPAAARREMELYLAGGCMAVLMSWITDPRPDSVEQVDELAQRLWQLITRTVGIAAGLG